jgi:hypothetical protein
LDKRGFDWDILGRYLGMEAEIFGVGIIDKNESNMFWLSINSHTG